MLDATTVVTAVALIEEHKLTPHSLHCLSVVIDAILLADSVVVFNPFGELNKKRLANALSIVNFPSLELRDDGRKLLQQWDFMDDPERIGKLDDPFLNGRAWLTQNRAFKNAPDPRHQLLLDMFAVLGDSSASRSVKTPSTATEREHIDDWLIEWGCIDTPLGIHTRANLKGEKHKLEVVRVARAIMYYRWMQVIRASYWPEYSRLRIFEDISRGHQHDDLLAKLLARKADAAKERDDLADFMEVGGYAQKLSVVTPLTLINVLDKAASSMEVFPIALDMRGHRFCRRFREKCGCIDLAADLGEPPATIRELVKAANLEAENGPGAVWGVLDLVPFPVFAYSPINGWNAESSTGKAGITSARALVDWWRRRHFSYLSRLRKGADKNIGDLNSLLNRLFGVVFTPAQTKAYIHICRAARK